jgi:hypothetical protein
MDPFKLFGRLVWALIRIGGFRFFGPGPMVPHV